MNERIKQLAEQCWVHTNKPLFGAKSPHWEFDRQKFAELIVQECITKSVEICMNRVQGDCWKNNQADIEALRCSQDIQRELPKHFGVEV